MSELEIIDDVPVTPMAFRQGGIFVLDGSTSMLDPIEPASPAGKDRVKASEVSFAVRELLTRFKVSRKATNFSFGLTTFHSTASYVGPMTALADIDDNGDYDPTASGTGGTLVAAGLEAAEQQAADYLAQGPAGIPASTVILVMSDGECSDPQRTITVANRIKQDPRITIACAYFATKGGGTGAGPALLQEVCSDPATLYKTVYDAETLRKFFESSMTAGATRAGLPAELLR